MCTLPGGVGAILRHRPRQIKGLAAFTNRLTGPPVCTNPWADSTVQVALPKVPADEPSVATRRLAATLTLPRAPARSAVCLEAAADHTKSAKGFTLPVLALHSPAQPACVLSSDGARAFAARICASCRPRRTGAPAVNGTERVFSQ